LGRIGGAWSHGWLAVVALRSPMFILILSQFSHIYSTQDYLNAMLTADHGYERFTILQINKRWCVLMMIVGIDGNC
jgi:hypothetical protein